MRILRYLFLVLLLLALSLGGLVSFWFANPTARYYDHVSSVLHQTEDGKWGVTITRNLPRGDFEGRWRLVVRVRQEKSVHACAYPPPVGSGEFSEIINYREENGPTLDYILADDVQSCLNEDPPISLTWTRQARLWGFLYLKPLSTTITIQPDVKPRPDDS